MLSQHHRIASLYYADNCVYSCACKLYIDDVIRYQRRQPLKAAGQVATERHGGAQVVYKETSQRENEAHVACEY